MSKPAVAEGQALALFPGSPRRMAEALAHRVAKCPNGIIRSYRVNSPSRSDTYENLWRRAGGIATGLVEFGVKPRDTIVLLIDDVVDFVPAFWACIRAGFIATPLMGVANEAFHRKRGDAFRSVLNRLSCVTILADEKFAEIASVLRDDRGLPLVRLDSMDLAATDFDEECASANPLCLIPTSSATGGLKLVAIDHDAQLNRCFAYKFNQRENCLGTFALDGITGQNAVFLRGASWTQIPATILTVYQTAILDAIETHQITYAQLTNSLLNRVIAAAQQRGKNWQLSSLRQIGLGGEMVVRDVVQRCGKFLARHGAPRDIIRAGYGTTETGYLVEGADPLESDLPDGVVSLGRCAPGVRIRIVGQNGAVLEEGQVGEVQVSCPQKIFSCYWGEPETTRKAFTADGWWRSGDLGQLQNDQLSIHGRTKELLILNGRKFALAEIDAEIDNALGTGDRAFSCAIMWPGEATERLAVVLVAGDAARVAELATIIRDFVAGRFGFSPDPIISASLADLPLAPNGKLRRHELVERIRSGALRSGRPLPFPTMPRGIRAAKVRLLSVVQEVFARWAEAFAAARRHPSQKFYRIAKEDPALVEKMLVQIWRQVLDLHGPLDRTANFFDLGGDSLRSLMLYTAIDEQFGKKISAEEFFASPTFGSLLELVRGHTGELALQEPSLHGPWALPAELRNKLLLHLETWDGERPTRDRLIIAVNTSGSKTPLFWVFQDAVQFHSLGTALGPDQPLYGLRSGAGVLDYTEDEIQALALRYISEISAVCPEGPLFVGGACQGAIIALAIAQHLLRRQRYLPLLILQEWGFPIQPFSGRVLLIYGRDSLQGNPYKRFRNPELAWRRAFKEYFVLETPGDHSNLFDPDYVKLWSKALADHMKTAEITLPDLLPDLARRFSMHSDKIPEYMVSGARHDIAVSLKNESGITWPAWEKSGLALGNRWLDQAGQICVWIDGRVAIPELPPGTEVLLSLSVTAPTQPGALHLIVDVVEEGNHWFHDAQNALIKAGVNVTAPLDARLEPSSLTRAQVR